MAVLIILTLLCGLKAWPSSTKKSSASSHFKTPIRILEEPEITVSSTGLKKISPFVSALITNFSGQDSADFSSKAGWGMGVLGDIGLTSWSLETGFLFKDLGASIIDPHGIKDNLDLRCASFPVWAKYGFYSWKQNVLFLKAGLELSAVIAKDESGRPVTWPPLKDKNGTPFLSSVQPWFLEAGGGVGGSFHLDSQLDLILDVTYSEGTTSLIAHEDVIGNSVTFSTGLALSL